MSSIPLEHPSYKGEWHLPYRGTVGMISLIVAECAIFTIFVVAYLYFLGKSSYGPTPKILDVPVAMTVCLLSSSLTIWLAERAISRRSMPAFIAFWFLTFILGVIFLFGTAMEWKQLIFHEGLTVRTNVFGTTFYSLVGLHASHVTVGLIMMLVVLVLAVTGSLQPVHAERVKVLSLYWHFVDAVWVVVFTVVYIVGR